MNAEPHAGRLGLRPVTQWMLTKENGRWLITSPNDDPSGASGRAAAEALTRVPLNILAGFCRWAKNLLDFTFREVRLTARGSTRVAAIDPFRPGNTHHNYAAAALASRASVSR
jgi:hypothetical protein